ncbi:MAG TPA: carbon monoxide dehydrogenase subunit G [Acetobacteraceae bacterium]|nr:carbon monoxide dehydrogenase subunit G [Acetobacteraceae bacterium]
MDMTGERHIPAPRSMVWDALNDPEVLKTCIPGCERLEATSPQDLEATAAVRIGPIAARFSGKVHLSDLDPPNGYTISGEGQGGVAGFAKGGAKVHLADEGIGATLLTYEVNAQVGGKIAQLGARLIDSTAKSMADSFFNKFTEVLTEKMGPSPDRAFPSAPSAAIRPVSPAAIPRPVSLWSMIPPKPMGYPLAAWIGIALWLCIFFLIVGPLL